MVSSGGVFSMSLSETYPAVLMRMLGKTTSLWVDGDGLIISCSTALIADSTDAGEVISHS
jgi:hypothetical protein